MKITSNKLALIPKMYCTLFNHEYQVSKNVTSHVKEYRCKNCKKELTTDSNGNLTELTPTFREINAILERVYQSKTERLKEKVMNTSVYQQV
ncbi:hypothetical protein JJL45_00965 [Tamlana sp. s12]|uniref:hypothetical protein n=1 Tax=Flavobacteriaceae TaxID=49546 RepID=UPI0007FBC5A3|nr:MULTISPECIES: hypothetical protein [Tamlana]OBQ57214.1 hypothetical protein VQ01_01700 [Tamlana sp. s12]QQY82598.1 hypothetical protein JJL45_00965 [Tamlana sp. s12]